MIVEHAVTLQDLADGQRVLIAAIAGVDSKLDSKIDGLDAKFGNLSVKLDGFDAKFSAKFDRLSKDVKKLSDYTESGFKTMNERFDRLEDRTDKIEAMLDGNAYQH